MGWCLFKHKDNLLVVSIVLARAEAATCPTLRKKTHALSKLWIRTAVYILGAVKIL
jgi:hypothetical protein